MPVSKTASFGFVEMARTVSTIEFGDFQTPRHLTDEICRLLSHEITPSSILEPTCGIGSFLISTARLFPTAQAVGIEINPRYVAELQGAIANDTSLSHIRVINDSFFEIDWTALKATLSEPILIIGNPPWVTNAAVGTIGGSNLPAKSNFQRHQGLDAITGKSNFDISEWMIRRLVDTFVSNECTIALLCKTAVARKVLSYAWSADVPLVTAEMRRIDAVAHFGASVEACLLTLKMGSGNAKECSIYDGLQERQPSGSLAYQKGQVISNITLHQRWRHLEGRSLERWRSGVKHDCSKVMELRTGTLGLLNGYGELVDIEDTYLYPMLKSSDVASGRFQRTDRWMLVPQTAVGEDTAGIRLAAPRTWHYLESHAEALDRRASSIYRKRPRFSVFGVGDYTFAPWKVAISGLYKKLHFVALGPVAGRPVILDDTTYFLPCRSEVEAHLLVSLLNSEPAVEFFSARVFWDAKRPVTVDLLSKLDLDALAAHLGRIEELMECRTSRAKSDSQVTLFPSTHVAG